MKKNQLDFLKTTGHLSPVQENAQKELFGTRTMAKFEPRKTKAQLTKAKKTFVKVPKRDAIYIPAAYDIGSTVTSDAPRSMSFSDRQSTVSDFRY
jgi:hypothetical protein